MCGRYVSVMARTDLLAEYNAVRADGPEPPASYNVAPQTLINAVIDRTDPDDASHVERRIQTVRWGR